MCVHSVSGDGRDINLAGSSNGNRPIHEAILLEDAPINHAMLWSTCPGFAQAKTPRCITM